MWVGRARYALPAAALAGVAAVALVPALSGAASPPGLPAQSVQQLLAQAVQAKVPQLSGTLTWSSNLGLSDLSSLENELGVSPGSSASSASGGTSAGFDPLSLLSGSYQIKVWLDGTTAEHLALINGQESEIDVVRNANQAWLWDSTNESVLHLVGPAGGSSASPGSSGAVAPSAVPTPQQVATSILQHLSPTTSVTESSPVWVAGQPAYQLVISPRAAPGSTINYIGIAIGSSGELAGVPVQVAVYANGLSTAALELGFTGSLQLGAPPASELTFTPPPGSTVTTRDVGNGAVLGSGLGSGWTGVNFGSGVTKAGSGWATVLEGNSAALAGGAGQAELGPLTSAVTIGGQQARLFSTYLLNVLFMPGGNYYVGFVAPSVLEAAASQGS